MKFHSRMESEPVNSSSCKGLAGPILARLDQFQQNGFQDCSPGARRFLVSCTCFGPASCREIVYAYLADSVSGGVSAAIPIPYTCITNESSSNSIAYMVGAKTQSIGNNLFNGPLLLFQRYLTVMGMCRSKRRVNFTYQCTLD